MQTSNDAVTPVSQQKAIYEWQTVVYCHCTTTRL